MNEDIHDQINDIVNSLAENTAEESLESAFVAGRLSAAFYGGLIHDDADWDDETLIHLVASFATQAFVLLEESAVEEGGD